MTPAKPRAAIYVRISQDRDQKSEGVKRQEKDLRALCKDRGWDVVEVFNDNDKSAFSGEDRPRYNALIRGVAAGDFDRVAVWHMSRLFRARAERVRDLDVFRAAGVTIAVVKGTDLDLSSASGLMVADLLGAFDSYESELKSERVAAAAQQRAETGKYLGGRRRLGYTPRADALVPEEADVIRDGYDAIAKGASLRAVAEDWRQRIGVGAGGGKLTSTQVRTVLLRPMNAGLSVHKGKIVGRSLAPAIVDEDTWRHVRAILTDPARRSSPGRPTLTLLSPVLRCGVCKGSVGAKVRIRKGVHTPAYGCRDGHVSRSRALLDEEVGGLVVDYLTLHADALTRPVPASTGKAAAAATTEASKLRERLDALSLLVAAGDLDPSDYAAATREVRSRLAALDARAVEARGHPASVAMLSSGDVAAAWKAATVDARRVVITELIERIDVGRGTSGTFNMDGVEIEWKAWA